MDEEAPEAASAEQDWFFEIVSDAHRFVCEVGEASRDQLVACVRAFAEGLPLPASRRDRVMLRAWLMEFAVEWAERDHRRMHRDDGPASLGACRFSSAAAIARRWTRDNDAVPADVFRACAEAYLTDVGASHGGTPAVAVRALLRGQYAERLSVADLAARFSTTTAELTSSFRALTGLSIGEYRENLRVREGIRLLETTDWKVEVIALTVGYRSKKNFYAALKRHTGCAPRRLRSVASEPKAGGARPSKPDA